MSFPKSFKEKDSFPTIIHQIWLQGRDKVPDKFKENICSIISFHPCWSYKIWDEERILPILSPKQLKTYKSLQHLHQKVDYARYIILYLYGGIYIDIDASCLKALDKLFEENSDYNLVISKVNTNFLESLITCYSKECVNNGVIISKKGCKELLELIDYINENCSCSSLTPKFFCINTTTGPFIFTKIIGKGEGNVRILEPEYLEPCIQSNCNITENTYIAHRHEGSWFNSSIKWILKFYLSNKLRFWILILLGITIIYKRT